MESFHTAYLIGIAGLSYLSIFGVVFVVLATSLKVREMRDKKVDAKRRKR